MSMQYSIVPFNPADLDQVLQLFHDTIHTINRHDYSQEQINAWAPKNPDRQRWTAKLTQHITYVAKIGDMVVGFADATPQGYIDHVYTHKDFQGKGTL